VGKRLAEGIGSQAGLQGIAGSFGSAAGRGLDRALGSDSGRAESRLGMAVRTLAVAAAHRDLDIPGRDRHCFVEELAGTTGELGHKDHCCILVEVGDSPGR